MPKWKSSKLPITGCPVCIGDGHIHGEYCTTCNGTGYFETKGNHALNASTINDRISKSIKNGSTNKR